MTRIETETTIAASPRAVWRTLLEHDRWAGWTADGTSGVRLHRVEPVGGTQGSIGAQRRCTASLPRFPGLGKREIAWTERISDMNAPWTIEYEAPAARALRHWRLRIVLVEQPDGQTRMRWRLSYVPQRLVPRIADRLFLRRSFASSLRVAAAGLAKTFEPIHEPGHDAQVDAQEATPDEAHAGQIEPVQVGDSSLVGTMMAEQKVPGTSIDSKAAPIAV